MTIAEVWPSLTAANRLYLPALSLSASCQPVRCSMPCAEAAGTRARATASETTAANALPFPIAIGTVERSRFFIV